MGVGFHPPNEGIRRRKTIRGNVVTDEIVQINVKIVEKPTHAKEPRKKEKKEEKAQPKKETETQTTEATPESKQP
jgi:small subunit ribosomal protein S6e